MWQETIISTHLKKDINFQRLNAHSFSVNEENEKYNLIQSLRQCNLKSTLETV